MEVVREAPLREHVRHLGRHTHRAPPDGIRIAHQMDVQKVELRLLARGRIRDKVLHGRTQLERRPGLAVHEDEGRKQAGGRRVLLERPQLAILVQ